MYILLEILFSKEDHKHISCLISPSRTLLLLHQQVESNYSPLKSGQNRDLLVTDSMQ